MQKEADLATAAANAEIELVTKIDNAGIKPVDFAVSENFAAGTTRSAVYAQVAPASLSEVMNREESAAVAVKTAKLCCCLLTTLLINVEHNE